MRSVVVVLVALLLTIASYAQDACPQYNRLIAEADSFFNLGSYRKALNKYNSAKICSPSKRAEVDSNINRLFEKIDSERRNAIDAKQVAIEATAKANEATAIANKMNKLLDKKNLEEKARAASIAREFKKSEDKRKADSAEIADGFIKKYRKLTDSLPDSEKNQLLDTVVSLYKQYKAAVSDTLATSLQLFENAKVYRGYFFDLLKKNFETSNAPNLFDKKKLTGIYDPGCVSIDINYYRALTKLSEALNLLPSHLRAVYEPKIQAVSSSLKDRREWLQENYWLPDTVVEWPANIIYSRPSANNQNFDIEHTSYEDYRKLELRFLNLSVKDFSLTTNTVSLSSKGKVYHVLAADADYRYAVVKEVPYALKKNLVAYETSYKNPSATRDVIKLLDRNELLERKENILKDFSDYSSNSYFFTPDGNFLATWKNSSGELVLYNIKGQIFLQFPDADSAKTMSFSSDSKMMVYYNKVTKKIYLLDLAGAEPGKIFDEFPPGISGIRNIDFTGSNSFLRINTDDSTIILYNLDKKEVVFQFSEKFVRDIVVAPNRTDVLITCNRYYSYSGYLTYLVDINLHIKEKLFADCENFFFSSDGKFIVGYDQYGIMRWQTDRQNPPDKNFQTCLSFLTLVERDCLPYDYFLTINDVGKIEQGARRFYTVANDTATKDPILKNTYYLQSQLLFDRLKSNPQNREERIPFFYDWSNFIKKNIFGNRDFSEQFNKQADAVEIFDNLVNSPDSIYPQLLYYAANGNMLLANLYDSLHAYRHEYIDQIKKEISLRERVFRKDPENYDNIFYLRGSFSYDGSYYFKGSFKRLSDAYDNVGWQKLKNRLYADRLTLYKEAENYFSWKLKSTPDSFNLKKIYNNVLAQLAANYLYACTNKPEEYAKGLDSAFYFVKKGLDFNKDPANNVKTQFSKEAFKSLSDICDTVGGRYFQNGQYIQRLALYRAEENYFSSKLQSVPDSFGLKQIYNNTAAQLAYSYLDAYINNPAKYAFAYDSAFYFGKKYIKLFSADEFDSPQILITAFKRLSNICDNVGLQDLDNKQYIERLALYRAEEKYFSSRIKSLPDSFGLKEIYIGVLAQLAPSYLYVYANKPKEYTHALDSAIYFAEKGLALSPADKFDSARLLIVKARTYLLQENDPGKALELYRLVINQFSEIAGKVAGQKMDRPTMLGQLQRLKDAGAQSPNIGRVEEFLKQGN